MRAKDMSSETEVDGRLLALIRAGIAAQSLKKKTLARRCHISPQRFSEILHGDRPMPQEVREKLVKELGFDKGIPEDLVCSLGLALGGARG
jgi:ribosome-binding protein aMBF1 (putative translation factor)